MKSKTSILAISGIVIALAMPASASAGIVKKAILGAAVLGVGTAAATAKTDKKTVAGKEAPAPANKDAGKETSKDASKDSSTTGTKPTIKQRLAAAHAAWKTPAAPATKPAGTAP